MKGIEGKNWELVHQGKTWVYQHLASNYFTYSVVQCLHVSLWMLHFSFRSLVLSFPLPSPPYLLPSLSPLLLGCTHHEQQLAGTSFKGEPSRASPTFTFLMILHSLRFTPSVSAMADLGRVFSEHLLDLHSRPKPCENHFLELLPTPGIAGKPEFQPKFSELSFFER